MADFVHIKRDRSNADLIINADTIEYMYEIKDRLGNVNTQISFVSGRTLEVPGQISKQLKVRT